MSGIPAGITTALVHLDAPVSFIGDVGRIHATVTASIPLVWEATGTPVGNFVDNISLDPGVELALNLPHVDQPGFLDGSGNTITGWYYRIEITYEKDGQNIPFPARDFQILTGQVEVDLALIPSGEASVPSVAPILPVTDIAGLTGSVTLAELGLDIIDLNGYVKDAKLPQRLSQAALTAAFGNPMIMMTPAKFPGINNTGTVATHAAVQAAVDAAPIGAILVFVGTYLFTQTVNVPPEKMLTLHTKGATFIRGGSATLFSCVGTFDGAFGIGSYTSEAIVIDGEAATVTKLTMNVAPNWIPNDIIRVSSDDIIVGAHVTSTTIKPRRAEFAEVLSVSGTTVYLRGLLREDFTLSPRGARLPYGSVIFSGGTLDVTDTVVTNKTEGTMIRIQNLTSAVVEHMTAKRLVGMGLSFKSNYSYYTQNYNVTWGMNDPTNGVFSYGIHDSSNANGVVVGGVQRSLRHPFTDGTADTLSGSTDISSFGRTTNTKIIGVTSVDCTAAGFDTHHMSRNVHFMGCTAYVSPEVNGFLIRGYEHTISDCRVVGGLAAVNISTQVTGAWSEGESWAHAIEDLKVTDSRRVLTVAVRATNTHPNYNVRALESTVTMDGVKARGVERFGVVLNGNVRIRDAVINMGTKADGAIIQSENAAFDFEGTLDLSAVTSVGTGTQRLFNVDPLAGQKSDFRLGKVLVKSSAAYRAATATPSYFSAETERVRIEDLVFETPWATSNPFPINDATAATVRWSCVYNPADSLSRRTSGSVGFSDAALEGSLMQLFRASDPQLVLTANVTSALTARTLTALPDGQYDGQRLRIILGSSSNTVTITHGGTRRLAGGLPRVLSLGNQALDLIWSNGAWREGEDRVYVSQNGTRFMLGVDNAGSVISISV